MTDIIKDSNIPSLNITRNSIANAGGESGYG
jgi:hypothetical protein